ncbi:hypothetical protein [Gabonibacter chumensis]|uniref:hypothetical protein n=1 Tax=Gabonibacter chumensis TaxID=2972474 RepID=UPI0025730398|nr:hypothetical protein [Gabonibacter chumensis]MCR9013204.1 hypothetical protein [Gabonibacter chumensis]
MEFLLTIPLMLLIRSDFKRRVVSVYTLLVFGSLQFIVVLMKEGIYETVIRTGINSVVLLFLGIGVCLYLLLKYGPVAFATRRFIGSGDIVFLFFLTPAFAGLEFPKFLVISFLLTLVGWGVCCKRKRELTIPLVATVGICYLIRILIRFLFPMCTVQYSTL